MVFSARARRIAVLGRDGVMRSTAGITVCATGNAKSDIVPKRDAMRGTRLDPGALLEVLNCLEDMKWVFSLAVLAWQRASCPIRPRSSGRLQRGWDQS